MKNLFAFDEDGLLIHINQVDKKQKANYFCIKCEEQLIARKGKIREHHFAHKPGPICNYESYLHKLGKLLFYETYTKCLNEKEPFYVQYATKKTCVSCVNQELYNYQCNLPDDNPKFDLTSYFNEIYLESKFENFIPDLILKSSKSDEVIFIEIAVTHFCEDEKLNSGNRIVEIPLSNETDLEFLNRRPIILNNSNSKIINFKTKEISGKLISPIDCKEKFVLFSINKDGIASKETITMSELNIKLYENDFLESKIFRHEINDHYDPNPSFSRLVYEASRNGIQVLNCNACQHSKDNLNPNDSAVLICERKGVGLFDSNTAFDCTDFKRI